MRQGARGKAHARLLAKKSFNAENAEVAEKAFFGF
jgi:hypothetical protein